MNVTLCTAMGILCLGIIASFVTVPIWAPRLARAMKRRKAATVVSLAGACLLGTAAVKHIKLVPCTQSQAKIGVMLSTPALAVVPSDDCGCGATAMIQKFHPK